MTSNAAPAARRSALPVSAANQEATIMTPHRPGRGPRGPGRAPSRGAHSRRARDARARRVRGRQRDDSRLGRSHQRQRPVRHLASAGSADGSHVFLVAEEQLVGADADAAFDVYERAGGATALVSTGPVNGDGPFEASSWSPRPTAPASSCRRLGVRSCAPTPARPSDVYERSGGVSDAFLLDGSRGGTGGSTPNVHRRLADASARLLRASEAARRRRHGRRHRRLRACGGATTLVSTRPRAPATALRRVVHRSPTSRRHPRFLPHSRAASSPPTRRRHGRLPADRRRDRARLDRARQRQRQPERSLLRCSADARACSSSTAEALVGADTGGAFDVYSAGRHDRLVSDRPVNGDDIASHFLVGTSTDGSRVFFATSEQLVVADTDGAVDVYERAGGATALVSLGAVNGNGPFGASYAGVSADGSRVFFQTAEPLVGADTDAAVDLYDRSAGTTTLVSRGAVNGNGPQDASFAGAALNGSHVYFQTAEPLVGDDNDAAVDLYERSGGTTTLVSRGAVNGNGPLDAYYAGASADGSRVFFQTAESLVGADADTSSDVYLAELAADSPVSPTDDRARPSDPEQVERLVPLGRARHCALRLRRRPGSLRSRPEPPALELRGPSGRVSPGARERTSPPTESARSGRPATTEGPVNATFRSIERLRGSPARRPRPPRRPGSDSDRERGRQRVRPQQLRWSGNRPRLEPQVRCPLAPGQDRAGNAQRFTVRMSSRATRVSVRRSLAGKDGSRHRAG